MRLIDADAQIDDLMERYCKECNKRRGIKNGKYRIIYEIGEAPCRACEVDDVKAELEDAPTIDAQEIVRCKNCRYNPDNPRPFYDDDPVETYAWCKTEYFGDQGFCSCGKLAINLQ